MIKDAIVVVCVSVFFAWAIGKGRPSCAKALFVLAFIASAYGIRWANDKQDAVYARMLEVVVSKRERTAFDCGAIAQRGGEELTGACAKFKEIGRQ